MGIAKKEKLPRSMEFTSSFGNTFTLQRVNSSSWIEQMDKMQRSEKINHDTTEYMLKTVVVTPGGLTIDDFDDDDKPYNGFAELQEVVEEARAFQLNKRRA